MPKKSAGVDNMPTKARNKQTTLSELNKITVLNSSDNNPVNPADEENMPTEPSSKTRRRREQRKKQKTISEPKKMIALKTFDNKTISVEESVALQSQTLKHMIEDGYGGETIPIPNVDGKTLTKVMDYCKRHAKADNKQALETFDTQFVNVDQKTLYELMMAANFLEIKSLLDLTCRTASSLIKGKTAEEIRAYLEIENDFTPEEEDLIRLENAWAFEKL